MFRNEFEARDLDSSTWKDFEELFMRYGGVQGGCWCMYYHRTGTGPGNTQNERTEHNHRDIHDLVISGKNRSVLVYYHGKAVASAQYGTSEELPRTGNGRNYRVLNLPETQKRLWRITCFFVDRPYRRKGAASFALDEILKRISELGGGIVEAYPVTSFKAYQTWFGTASMYSGRGFHAVSPLGKGTLLMRREI